MRFAYGLLFLPPLGALFWAFAKSFSSVYLKSPAYLKAFLNTLILSLGATSLAILVSLPLAILLAKTRFPLARLWGAFLIVPLLFLPYQTALAWSFIIPQDFLKLFFSFWGVIFVFTLCFFPLVFWPLYLAFINVPKEAEESALLLKPPLRVFATITLPYVKPYLLGGAGLCFIFCFTEVSVPTYLGVPVIGTEILARFAAFYDLKGALNLSLPLLFIGLLLFFLERPLLHRWEIPSSWTSSKGLHLENKVFLAIGALFLFCILAVAVFLPLFLLFLKSASVDWRFIFEKARLPLLRTLSYALLGALGAGVITLLAQLLLGEKERNFWETLGLLAFFLPPVVLAVGLIYFWQGFPPVYHSSLLLIFGFLCRFAFLVQRVLGEAWRRFNKEELEAAYLVGKGFRALLLRIIFPPLRPWFGLSLALFFVFAANEIILSSLLYPPGGATLAVTIYTLSVNNPLAVSAGLCLLNTISIFAVASLLLFLCRPRFYGSSIT